ncbi:hypothetical protein [Pedobacter nototheniae]|uniref:hypothetical protein n=1 Tax=Pedobacter nototheniae TaxID=2488994 RepID=UPI00104066FA|nr:hypothetical protein [Pedobacter nototheniae]
MTKKLNPQFFQHYQNWCTCFAIKFTFKIDDNEQSMQNLTQLCCVEVNDGVTYWEIDKKDFFINNDLIDNPLYDLSKSCLELLYPIKFSIDSSGFLISILNYDEIKQRWNDEYELLQQKFGGSINTEYMEQISESLKTQSALSNILTNDIFLSLFFTNVKGQEIKLSLPNYDNHQVFSGIWLLNAKKNELKRHSQIFNGSLKVAQGYLDSLSGQIKVHYDIDDQKYHIRNIEAAISITESEKKNTFSFSANEVFNEETEIKKQTMINNMEKRKSGWGILFND